MRTHYEWLEIAENASPEVIRGAFKYLVQRWHPDKNPDNPELARITLREINEAFKVLSDPEARKSYDHWLREQRLHHRRFDRRRTDRAPSVPGKEARDPAESRRRKRGRGKPHLDTWA